MTIRGFIALLVGVTIGVVAGLAVFLPDLASPAPAFERYEVTEPR